MRFLETSLTALPHDLTQLICNFLSDLDILFSSTIERHQHKVLCLADETCPLAASHDNDREFYCFSIAKVGTLFEVTDGWGHLRYVKYNEEITFREILNTAHLTWICHCRIKNAEKLLSTIVR
jgi:hypothetical protein